MPTYNVAGLSIFIPDLNEITQAIVGPIETAIGAIQQQIVIAVVNSLSFLSSLGQSIANTVSSVILPSVGLLLAPVQTFLSQIYNGILSIPSVVQSTIQGIASQVGVALNSTASQIQGFFQTYVIVPLQQAQSFIVTQFNAGLSSVQNFLSGLRTDFITFLQQTEATIRSDFVNAQNFVNARITELQQNVAATNQFVSTAVNQLSVNLSSFGTAFSQGFIQLGPILVQSLIKEIAALIPAVTGPLVGTLTSVLQPITNVVKNELLNRLPRSPDEALNAALTITEVGLGTFIAGELATIGLEALYPTKHLGITEAFHKGIEILGITAVTAGLYGIIVTSGFRIRLEQYFNFNLQPKKIAIETARESVYYQVRDITAFQTAMRYEGFEDDAIDAATRTIYKPLAPRFLVKLLDEEIFDNDFYTRQLLQSGLDPANVPNLLKSLQILSMKSFAASAKQQIFTASKDGLLDPASATNILTAFGTPKDQIGWILMLANIQYVIEQKILIKDSIIKEVTKGTLDPGSAVGELISLGYDGRRAAVLVRIAGISAAPTPNKADRLALAAEVLNIPLVV